MIINLVVVTIVSLNAPTKRERKKCEESEATEEQVPHFLFFLRCLKRFNDTGITLSSTQYKDG